MSVDVPAHVQIATYVENHILVDAGNNWDASRTARVTPVVLLPEPEPVVAPAAVEAATRSRFSAGDQIIEGDMLAVIHFPHEGITLSKVDRHNLLQLAKDQPLRVVAHGDADESDANRLSRVRAKAVTTFLRSKGYRVQTVKAFGSTRPAPEGGTEANRIVQIFQANSAEKKDSWLPEA